MSYWNPRSEAPIAYCMGGGCNQRTDCRRWLLRTQLAAMGATSLPIDAQWKLEKKPLEPERQVCEQFLPREG